MNYVRLLCSNFRAFLIRKFLEKLKLFRVHIRSYFQWGVPHKSLLYFAGKTKLCHIDCEIYNRTAVDTLIFNQILSQYVALILKWLGALFSFLLSFLFSLAFKEVWVAILLNCTVLEKLLKISLLTTVRCQPFLTQVLRNLSRNFSSDIYRGRALKVDFPIFCSFTELDSI